MALEATQPLTEMSTRNLPGGKGRPARKADNLTAICETIVYKMWEPRRLMGLHGLLRNSFTFYLLPHTSWCGDHAHRQIYPCSLAAFLPTVAPFCVN
jgi:hypothetical protein